MLLQASDASCLGYFVNIVSCLVESIPCDDFVISQGSDKLVAIENLSVQDLSDTEFCVFITLFWGEQTRQQILHMR